MDLLFDWLIESQAAYYSLHFFILLVQDRCMSVLRVVVYQQTEERLKKEKLTKTAISVHSHIIYRIGRKQEAWTPEIRKIMPIFFFFFLKGCARSIWRFPGQGLNRGCSPGLTTATAMRDLSHICGLHQSLRPHQILDPLHEARDRTHILVDTSWGHYH